MSDNPKVSVIICAYQAERTLGGAISSVLTQGYQPVEIIVCDDGSTDGTAGIAASYGDQVTLVRQPNAGPASARNTAAAAATGELIALLDADDIMLPSYLERAVQVWQRAGGGRRFVTCDAYTFGAGSGLGESSHVLPAGPVPSAHQRMRILERNFVTIFSVLPTQMWRELDGMAVDLPVSEDYDLWGRAILAGWEVLFQPERLALYRRSEGSLSTRVARMAHYEQLMRARWLERYADSLTAAERARLELSLELGSSVELMERGELALAEGDVRSARAAFADAARLIPSDRRLQIKAHALRLPGVDSLYATAQRARRRDWGK